MLVLDLEIGPVEFKFRVRKFTGKRVEEFENYQINFTCVCKLILCNSLLNTNCFQMEATDLRPQSEKFA